MAWIPQALAMTGGAYLGAQMGNTFRSRMTRRPQNKNLSLYQMPTKRKAMMPAQTFGYRNKRRKSFVPRPMKFNYRQRMGTDRLVIALKDLQTKDLTHDADQHDVLQYSNVTDCPGFQRYANLYDRFRVLKFSIKWLTGQDVHQIISFVSQEDKSTESNVDQYLKQRSCRFHNVSQHGQFSPQRTLDLAKIPSFRDFIKCDLASSQLSKVNATPFDAAIKYVIKHHRNGHQDLGLHYVQCEIRFVVEFIGLQATTQCD